MKDSIKELDQYKKWFQDLLKEVERGELHIIQSGNEVVKGVLQGMESSLVLNLISSSSKKALEQIQQAPDIIQKNYTFKGYIWSFYMQLLQHIFDYYASEANQMIEIKKAFDHWCETVPDAYNYINNDAVENSDDPYAFCGEVGHAVGSMSMARREVHDWLVVFARYSVIITQHQLQQIFYSAFMTYLFDDEEVPSSNKKSIDQNKFIEQMLPQVSDLKKHMEGCINQGYQKEICDKAMENVNVCIAEMARFGATLTLDQMKQLFEEFYAAY